MSRITTLVLASLVALAPTSGAARSASEPMHPKLVRTIMDVKLGEVLTTSSRQAIYVWRSEPRGTIRCTGSCANAWPPVRVAKGVMVPMHYAGIEGDFGTIRRPDGSRQLTLDRRALYTYAHEKPGRCSATTSTTGSP
jgi:predicted lipoprotein with Yx(FWY)xxD motif